MDAPSIEEIEISRAEIDLVLNNVLLGGIFAKGTLFDEGLNVLCPQAAVK